jgi:hypothetical protein
MHVYNIYCCKTKEVYQENIDGIFEEKFSNNSSSRCYQIANRTFGKDKICLGNKIGEEYDSIWPQACLAGC